MSVSVSSQRVGRLEFWLKHLIAYVSGTADSVDNSVTLRETFLVSVCLVQILCKNESPTFHSLELLLRSLFIFWLVLSNNGLYGNSLVHRHSGRQPYLLLFRNIPWETLFCPFFFLQKTPTVLSLLSVLVLHQVLNKEFLWILCSGINLWNRRDTVKKTHFGLPRVNDK